MLSGNLQAKEPFLNKKQVFIKINVPSGMASTSSKAKKSLKYRYSGLRWHLAAYNFPWSKWWAGDGRAG